MLGSVPLLHLNICGHPSPTRSIAALRCGPPHLDCFLPTLPKHSITECSSTEHSETAVFPVVVSRVWSPMPSMFLSLNFSIALPLTSAPPLYACFAVSTLGVFVKIYVFAYAYPGEQPDRQPAGTIHRYIRSHACCQKDNVERLV